MMRKEAIARLLEGGFVPAMPLVLTEKREFDEEGQRRLIRYYLASGVDGIAACVHTTQFEIRLPQHNLLARVLSVCADEIARFEKETGRTVIKIAGVCGQIEQAVSEAELAESLGYDCALLSPGGLKAFGEDYLIERTEKVSEILPVVAFYLQTAVGGRVFSSEYWTQICKIPNVVAVKCAAFNRYFMLDVARAIANADHPIALYTGNDDNIVTDLLTEFTFGEKSVRCVGGLLGHWAVWTNTAVRIFREIKKMHAGESVPAHLMTLAAKVTDANGAFFDVHNDFKGCIAGVHEVLYRQGLMKGIWCLNPEETLSPGQKEEIDRVYKLYPELNDDAFVKEFLEKEQG